MEKHEIYLKKSNKYFQIPIADQSAIFLKRYSSELEFMDPWAQHENYFENNHRIVNHISGVEEIKIKKEIVLTKNENDR